MSTEVPGLVSSPSPRRWPTSAPRSPPGASRVRRLPAREIATALEEWYALKPFWFGPVMDRRVAVPRALPHRPRGDRRIAGVGRGRRSRLAARRSSVPTSAGSVHSPLLVTGEPDERRCEYARASPISSAEEAERVADDWHDVTGRRSSPTTPPPTAPSATSSATPPSRCARRRWIPPAEIERGSIEGARLAMLGDDAATPVCRRSSATSSSIACPTSWPPAMRRRRAHRSPSTPSPSSASPSTSPMQTATADSSSRSRRRRAAPTRLLDRAWRPVAAASTIAFRVAFGSLVAFSCRTAAVAGLGRRVLPVAGTSPDLRRLRMGAPAAGAADVRPRPRARCCSASRSRVGRRTRLRGGCSRSASPIVELIDAALYLNHYWFMTLAAVVLAVVPQPGRDGTVPAITVWALRAQLAVVYVFAGLAKLNADWLLHGQPMRIWLAARTDRPLIGAVARRADRGASRLSWAGAVFDLTIVAWLLWRRSRPWAYVAVVVFHAATAALFQIGLFPWVMIALTPIFFAPDWPLRWSRGEQTAVPRRHERNSGRRATVLALGCLATINLVLPLRHWVAPGDVRINDDGYYLAWRVMLVERVASVRFEVTDPATGGDGDRRAGRAARRMATRTSHVAARSRARHRPPDRRPVRPSGRGTCRRMGVGQRTTAAALDRSRRRPGAGVPHRAARRPTCSRSTRQ